MVQTLPTAGISCSGTADRQRRRRLRLYGEVLESTAPHVRLVAPLAGGETSGTVAMSFDVDDLVSFGELSQSYYETRTGR